MLVCVLKCDHHPPHRIHSVSAKGNKAAGRLGNGTAEGHCPLFANCTVDASDTEQIISISCFPFDLSVSPNLSPKSLPNLIVNFTLAALLSSLRDVKS